MWIRAMQPVRGPEAIRCAAHANLFADSSAHKRHLTGSIGMLPANARIRSPAGRKSV